MHKQTTPFDVEAPDGQLVEMILSGLHVQAAWDVLLARYSNLIYTVPVRYGLQPSDADDVYQAVCKAFWKDMARIRERDRLAAWLLKVAGHMSWRVLMSRRRQARRESALVEAELPASGSGLRPDELVLRREEWQAVAVAVRSLSERCQTLIWYLYYDPAMLSYEEIARRMGLAEGSIGPNRGRCLSQLKERLRHLER